MTALTTARILSWGGGTVVLVPLILLASTQGPVGQVLAVAAAIGVTVIAVLGAERTGTLLMVAALFLAPMNDLRPVVSADFVTFSDLMFVLGAIMLAPQVISGRAELPRLFVVGAGIMTVTGFLGSVMNESPVLSLFFFARMVAALMILPLVIVMWGPSFGVIRVLAWAYVSGQVVSTVGGLLQGPFNNRYLGLTTHPNFFGICAAVATGLVLYLFHHARGSERGLAVVAGMITLGSVVLSGSRAAVLAALIVGLLYPVLERSLRAGYALLVGGVGVLAVMVLLVPNAGPGNPLSRLQGDSSTRGSDVERSEALSQGWADFLDRPLTGDGFGLELTLVHNGYLEAAIAMGVFGLVGYLLLLSSLVVPVLRSRFRNPMGYAALAYMLILPFNNTLWDRFAWAALALVLAAERVTMASMTPPQSDGQSSLPTPMPSPTMPSVSQDHRILRLGRGTLVR